MTSCGTGVSQATEANKISQNQPHTLCCTCYRRTVGVFVSSSIAAFAAAATPTSNSTMAFVSSVLGRHDSSLQPWQLLLFRQGGASDVPSVQFEPLSVAVSLHFALQPFPLQQQAPCLAQLVKMSVQTERRGRRRSQKNELPQRHNFRRARKHPTNPKATSAPKQRAAQHRAVSSEKKIKN